MSSTVTDRDGKGIQGGFGPSCTDGGIVKDGKRSQVWISYHDGFSNAVKKPISLEEFIHGL